MSWLSGWLKELVVIILLASFMDLLLPNRSMQRYVKTIIGLFIVMVLLTPIFQLFQKGWDPNQLVKEAENLNNSQTGIRIKTLDEIMSESGKLKRFNEKEAVRIAQSQASQVILEGLRQSTGIAAQRVEVTAAPDDKGNLRVTRVEVVIPPAGIAAEPDKPLTGAEKSNGIEPIKPVAIQIRPQESRTQAGGGTGAGTDRGEEVQRIKLCLQREWQINPELAVVTFE